MTILPIDEINALKDKLTVHFDAEGHIASRQDADDIIDELLDLFLLAYSDGAMATNTELGLGLMPSQDAMDAAIYATVAGESWADRVIGYYESGGTLYDIQRIAETDATRIYNQGSIDAVVANDAASDVQKRWVTMMDDRVRDTHAYLENMTIPFADEFYTYDGDHAAAPGMFELPENNINCRCIVEVIRG